MGILKDRQDGPVQQPNVESILQQGQETASKRKGCYGLTQYRFGDVMKALFPEAVVLVDEEEHARFGLLVQIVSKLCRYTTDFHHPHMDSTHDLMVYAAMLNEMDGFFLQEDSL